MPRGGTRPGSGRKKGSTNRRIKRLRSVMREVALKIGKLVPDAFEGDGHALMVAIYKDPRIPIDMRLDAAAKAAPYEKPRLASVEHVGKDGGPIKIEDRSPRDLAKALLGILDKAGATDADH